MKKKFLSLFALISSFFVFTNAVSTTNTKTSNEESITFTKYKPTSEVEEGLYALVAQKDSDYYFTMSETVKEKEYWKYLEASRVYPENDKMTWEYSLSKKSHMWRISKVPNQTGYYYLTCYFSNKYCSYSSTRGELNMVESGADDSTYFTMNVESGVGVTVSPKNQPLVQIQYNTEVNYFDAHNEFKSAYLYKLDAPKVTSTNAIGGYRKVEQSKKPLVAFAATLGGEYDGISEYGIKVYTDSTCAGDPVITKSASIGQGSHTIEELKGYSGRFYTILTPDDGISDNTTYYAKAYAVMPNETYESSIMSATASTSGKEYTI